MGKSNKKAKSDRINALRKQYDAFLEEDKKRKERNEYILGRLDKMRISTALVPLRYKPILDARASAVNYVGYQPEAPSVRIFDQFPTQIKNNEDTCLIQEISKKYILIPKFRSPFTNNYIHNVSPENIKTMQDNNYLQKTIPIKDSKPDINENTDWKSKYEILNLLKNEEKQAAHNHTPNIDVSESQLKSNHEQIVTYNDNVKKDVHSEPSKKYSNELPEKDFAEDTLHYGFKTQDEPNPKEVVLSNLVLDTNITYNEDYESLTKIDDQTDTTNDKLRDARLEYKYSNTPNTGELESVLSHYETQPYNANMLSMDADCFTKQNIDTHTEKDIIENEYPDEDNFTMHNDNVSVEQHQFVNSEQAVHCNGDEASLTKDIHSDDLRKQLNHESSLDVNSYITEKGHSTEVILAQDFQANEGVHMKADPKIKPEEQTDLSINPTQQIEPNMEQIEPVIEQLEIPVDNITESIDDFNAEQRDMFYSEQSHENYQQNDGLNMDYSQNVYQQNEVYTFYEDNQSEAYPIDLTDQEETLRYDPNYEQQYSESDQGLVKQPIEQQPQQYRQPVGNQPQSDLELLQFEQPIENEKQIEEVLDIEDGYKAQQDAMEVAEQQHDVETVKIDKHDIPEIRASEQTMG